MKIAIFESITTPGGHEVDFDRILTDELQNLGHEVKFYVPDKFVFNYDYKVTAEYLPGEAVSYTGKRGIRKNLVAVKREFNRQRWYRAIYDKAVSHDVDAIIVPTSTYRYLRALSINKLKKSPIPIIFILHGINPKEAPSFFSAVESLHKYSNIHAVVLTFTDKVFGRFISNVTCINPPAYIPRDIDMQEKKVNKQVLKLGFFGQYRREKKLEVFLDAFLNVKYEYPIQLLVQGATNNPDDEEDFCRIIKKYSGVSEIEFLHKGLFGKSWQEAIAAIDVLLMPYAAPRYRYHWGGMLFTAIGFKKPVIMSSDINPEVMEKYHIGMTYDSNIPGDLQKTIETFINSYQDNAVAYACELARAYRDYHPNVFAQQIVDIIASTHAKAGS